MAEYYPLLAKAVAGLPNSTRETRHAIYERARKALLGQLRAVQPPVPEADIEKENLALDSAIARLETELAVPPPVEPAQIAAGVEPAIEAVKPVAAPPPPAAPPQRTVPTPPFARPRIAAQPATPQGPANEIPQNANPGESNRLQTSEIKDQASPHADRPTVSPANAQNATAANPMSVKMRPEHQRPVAPRVKGAKSGPKGLWIVLTVIGLIVAGVAFAAWKLRDRPEDLAKIKSAQTQQQTESNGKIVERANDAGKKNASATAATAAAPSAVQPPPESTTNVPVTYRAALLVQAPEEQSKVKTYYGTVIWRLDNVSNGPGEAVGTAIHANIDIPEDKFQAAMTLQKNVDASLSASHTMTIVFTVQPATPTGPVKQIGVPQMREENSKVGESLVGLLVPIMENSFLIGFARGASEATNLDLLKTRQWIDVPMLLADGRIAKLTFEKGVAGLRATEDAIASWQAQ